MKWNIITDTSSDLYNFEIAEHNLSLKTVPFAFNIGDKTIIDTPDLDTLELLTEIAETKEKVATACPSPQDYLNEMHGEGNYILITISGNLSGSANSANIARDTFLKENPTSNVEVIDSLSTGPGITILVEKLCTLIKEGLSFEEVMKQIREYFKDSKTTFALSCFDNLVKAGRMSKLSGSFAKLIGIWGVGIASEQGTIAVKKKVIGKTNALKAIIEDIKTRVSYPISVIISHCHNLPFAEKLRDRIKELWSKATVKIQPTRGLDSYYAEKNGIIVGFWGSKELSAEI